MLMNYVQLEVDKPALMHFSDHYFVRRQIKDPESLKMKWVESLVFWVDKLNEESSARTFSVLSTKLAAKLEPFLAEQKYQKYDFRITKRGAGYAVDWTVEALPLAGAESV
jgi:predicted Holliday junction resolvase-like endonuclease